MARRDYVWDIEAVKAIGEQTLDELYEDNERHYWDLANGVSETLRANSEEPDNLKHDDLVAALHPMIDRDKTTLAGMRDRGLPEPQGRLGPQWYSWFTHYVVERYQTTPARP